MRKLCKTICLFTTVAIILSVFAGCHPKDEIALTIGGVQIKSSTYMCALIQSINEAKSKVDENLSKESEGTSSDSKDVDYEKQKIDDVAYAKWIKNRALEVCKEYAYINLKFDELGLILTEEDVSTIKNYTDYYWTSNGYSTIYGNNGVSKETFHDFFTYSYKSNSYFKSIYGAGGSSPVSDEDIRATLKSKFLIANVLVGSFTDEENNKLSDDAVSALKQQFAGYADRIRAGASFKEINNEYKNVDESADNNTTDGEDKPKDSLASIIGAEGTTFANEIYDEVNAMTTGEIKIINPSDNSGVYLVVKGDIMADEYYFGYLTDAILSLMKQDEFISFVGDESKKIEAVENTFALNRFKVSNISLD